MIDIICGDVIGKLKELPDKSIHCCVTSPPYWGLRDYSRCMCSQTYEWAKNSGGYDNSEGHLSPRPKTANPDCPTCKGTGIIESVKEHQFGLEKTPEEYVQHLMEVFMEVRRVLRDDGTLWLNLGDSYATSATGSFNGGGFKDKSSETGSRDLSGVKESGVMDKLKASGLKSKNLVGIPWRVAFALQKDGWYLRSDIIWSKPNPMPESVRDRPTKSHEYIFLLTKSERYFWDQEAVRESFNFPERTYNPDTSNHKTRALSEIGNRSTTGLHDGRTQYGNSKIGRNIRSVWKIATQPYPEAHFATFPEELPRRCIKVGTSEKGCCSKCGAPYKRKFSKVLPTWTDKGVASEKEKQLRLMSQDIYGKNGNQKSRSLSDIYGRALGTEIRTIGWIPLCNCNAEIVPCIVLDPFAGSGTTGVVAKSLGRNAILIELNPEYVKLIKGRIKDE